MSSVEGETATGAVERSDDEIVREIGHEEYDPVGTLVLVGLYLLVLVVLWLFTYFVEFLGNGPTVIG